MCIFVSPVPQWPTEVRLHTLLTLALDSNERSVPCSGIFITPVIYHVQVLVGSDSVIHPTVGAAIQACYTQDKLIESMMTKRLSEFHGISTMIWLCVTQPANQSLIPLHIAPVQQSTPPSSLWLPKLWYAYHYWHTKQCLLVFDAVYTVHHVSHHFLFTNH